MSAKSNQSINDESENNRKLLANLVEQYHKKLTFKAASIVGDIYAEEIVQDVWETLVSGDVNLFDINSISHWLHRVVINKSLNRNKRENKVISLEQLTSNTCVTSKSQQMEIAIIDEASPEDILVGTQKVRAIASSWDALPETQKRALELRLFKGYSYQMIADELCITVSNAKVIIHRARSKVIEQPSTECV